MSAVVFVWNGRKQLIRGTHTGALVWIVLHCNDATLDQITPPTQDRIATIQAIAREVLARSVSGRAKHFAARYAGVPCARCERVGTRVVGEVVFCERHIQEAKARRGIATQWTEERGREIAKRRIERDTRDLSAGGPYPSRKRGHRK